MLATLMDATIVAKTVRRIRRIGACRVLGVPRAWSTESLGEGKAVRLSLRSDGAILVEPAPEEV